MVNTPEPAAPPADDGAVTQRPESRYGRQRSGPRRGLIAAYLVLALAVGVVVAVVGYQRFGSTDVKGETGGYHLVDEQTVEVTFSVTRADPSQPVVCIVRARSKDGSETGRRELLIEPSEHATVQVKTQVKTSHPPVIGDIYGCGTDVPDYLRSEPGA